MHKKIGTFLITLVLIIGFGANLSVADQQLESLKKQLDDLRWEIQEAESAYKNNLAQAKQECNDKINASKKKFHAERNQYITERKEKEKAIKTAHKKKLDPMLRQERKLIKQIEPKETDNFARQ